MHCSTTLPLFRFKLFIMLKVKIERRLNASNKVVTYPMEILIIGSFEALD